MTIFYTRVFWPLVFALVALPVVATLVFANTRDTWALVAFFEAIAFPSFLFSRQTWMWRKPAGYIQFSVAAYSLVATAVTIVMSKVNMTFMIFDSIIISTWLGSAGVAVGLLLVSVAGNIVAVYRGKRLKFVQPTGQPLDISFVNGALESMRCVINDVQRRLNNESAAVDFAILSFQKTMEQQQLAFFQLKKDLVEASKEVDSFKALAKLTKEQQEAFLWYLRRGKIIDYGVGFLIGVVTSLVAGLVLELRNPLGR